MNGSASTADSTCLTGWMAAKVPTVLDTSETTGDCWPQMLSNGPMIVDRRGTDWCVVEARESFILAPIGHNRSKWVALRHFSYHNWAERAKITLNYTLPHVWRWPQRWLAPFTLAFRVMKGGEWGINGATFASAFSGGLVPASERQSSVWKGFTITQ